MSAERYIIVDRPNDKESQYVCDCGFNKYLGETCNCGDCKQYELPLTKCPECGEEFVTKD